MTPSSNLRTPIIERAIFERIPKREIARRVSEADATVLVRSDAAADVGEFGNKLGLCYAWVRVAWVERTSVGFISMG